MNLIEKAIAQFAEHINPEHNYKVKVDLTKLGGVLQSGMPMQALFNWDSTFNCDLTLKVKDIDLSAILENVVVLHSDYILPDGGYCTAVFYNQTEAYHFRISQGRKEQVSVHVEICSTNNNLDLLIEELSSKVVIDQSENDETYEIHLLHYNANTGFHFSTKDLQRQPLIDVNYTPQTVEALNHAVSCLNSNCPCGKVLIMEGCPGTGKSFAIRHIVDVTNEDVFHVIVPVNMVPQLSGPELLELLSEDDISNKKRICFIIEDSDKIITQSESTAISEILNFGDGIIGEVLDARIILTTNLKRGEINEALIRPGRLCSYLKFDLLQPMQAEQVYKNITGELKSFSAPTSLASIYREAREDKFFSAKTANNGVGNYR